MKFEKEFDVFETLLMFGNTLFLIGIIKLK